MHEEGSALQPAEEPGVELARRLRGLRTNASMTQGAFAAVLGVTAQSVSSWEREDKVTVIPMRHLRSYAQFFAVERPAADGRRRLTDPAELTEEERKRQHDIEVELLALRNAAGGDIVARHPEGSSAAEFPGLRDSFWRFPNNRPITIVCAQLPQDQIMESPLTNPHDPDFVAPYTYSDIGALIEIYGHLRAVNPNSDVKIRPAHSELMSDDYTDHLVLLGGVDFNHVTQAVMGLIDLPVTQAARDTPGDPGVFQVTEDGQTRQFAPEILRSSDGARTLIRDIGHFYRGSNPYNDARTVTICNGMFGRGVEGAVRATTDPKFRDRNADHIRPWLQDGGSVSLLFRVAIAGGKPLTPDWTRPGTVLYESPLPPPRLAETVLST